MNNTELLRSFLEREKEWVRTLETVREQLRVTVGRPTGHIQWHAEIGIGTHAWLGYYWQDPPFWFGYGLGPHGWLPVVDASGRGCPLGVVMRLRDNLPHIWRELDFSRKTYWRLWAPADMVDTAEIHIQWLLARSRELHAFLVEE